MKAVKGVSLPIFWNEERNALQRERRALRQELRIARQSLDIIRGFNATGRTTKDSWLADQIARIDKVLKRKVKAK